MCGDGSAGGDCPKGGLSAAAIVPENMRDAGVERGHRRDKAMLIAGAVNVLPDQPADIVDAAQSGALSARHVKCGDGASPVNVTVVGAAAVLVVPNNDARVVDPACGRQGRARHVNGGDCSRVRVPAKAMRVTGAVRILADHDITFVDAL